MKLGLHNFLGRYAGKNKTILVIGDIHLPYQHPSAFSFLKEIKRKYKPTRIVSIGDLLDQHCFSRYDKDPEADSVIQEIEKARKDVQELSKIFPVMDIVTGNHDIRLDLKAMKAGIPKTVLKDKKDIYDIPENWKWHEHDLIIDDIFIVHGKTKAYNKLSKNTSMNAIQGHHHTRAGVTYWSSPLVLRWDAHTGCLIDPKHYAFHYAKNDVERPILSSLIIQEGQPTLIQMKMHKGGKWDKKVR